MPIIDPTLFNETQVRSYSLIRNDFKFIYSLLCYLPDNALNYYTQFMPYMATIVDGSEDWLCAVKQSCNLELPGRHFNSEEERFYSSVREGIKFWDSTYQTNYEALKKYFYIHKTHFESISSSLARKLGLVDVFGVFSTDNLFCGNTLLADLYIPSYDLLNEGHDKYLKQMAEFAGNYIALFDATASYSINVEKQFHDYDFGGFRKSPVGKTFSDKYVLMTIVCQINFIVHCIIDYFQNAYSTEIRFAYLLYYYLCGAINEINSINNAMFSLDSKYYSERYRNSVAHYRLGVSLNTNELNDEDCLYGLTQKYLGIDSMELRLFLIDSLEELSKQITKYLNLKPLNPIWRVN